jgi:hypothetical protein
MICAYGGEDLNRKGYINRINQLLCLIFAASAFIFSLHLNRLIRHKDECHFAAEMRVVAKAGPDSFLKAKTTDLQVIGAGDKSQ